MSMDETEDTTIFKVVVNHEEQYSIWPADRENAVGWRDTGKTGTKEECLAYIEEVWNDMRPLSLRQKMEDSNQKSAIAGERLLEPGADDKFSWHAAEVPVEERAAGRD